MLNTRNDHPILKFLQSKAEKLAIGLMSGTSMDGIDAALVKIQGSGLQTKVELIAFDSLAYPKKLKEKLLVISQPGKGTVDEICRLNVVVGEYFLDAVHHICQKAGYKIEEIDLIGTHGQTIHHLPQEEKYFGKKVRSTLQIGDPSIISARTNVLTVGLFRYSDMALGGQGAPLVPYFDFLMFRDENKNRVLLNIGGIANITILPRKCHFNEVVAFDTGPGNMVIDGLMRKLFKCEFDDRGKTAAKGKVSFHLLEKLLTHPFFRKAPPKSTGREEFGEKFIDHVLQLAKGENLSSEDIIATATELTSVAIKKSIAQVQKNENFVEELIVGGGGIFNKTLLASLKDKFPNANVLSSDELGIPSDAKEAICFAVLANETVHGIPANIPNTTGAAKPAILGAIFLGK